MNKITFFILGFLVFLFALSQSACRRCDDPTNPDCCNYDPCTRKANAEFKIEEYMGKINRWFETGDTISGAYMRFTALNEADSFVWKLGIEAIKGKSFQRNFFPDNEWITCTCIAYRKPALDCDLTDDGIDTFKRTFYVWDFLEPDNPNNIDSTFAANYRYPPILGYYRGAVFI